MRLVGKEWGGLAECFKWASLRDEHAEKHLFITKPKQKSEGVIEKRFPCKLIRKSTQSRVKDCICEYKATLNIYI